MHICVDMVAGNKMRKFVHWILFQPICLTPAITTERKRERESERGEEKENAKKKRRRRINIMKLKKRTKLEKMDPSNWLL